MKRIRNKDLARQTPARITPYLAEGGIMNSVKRTCLVLLGMFGTCFIWGCGGGGSTPTSSKAVASTGVITGFGSVYVNGVKYTTQNTTRLMIENQEMTVSQQTVGQRIEDRLRLGMLVTVSGTIDDNGNGTATQIEYEDNLQGRVTAVNTATNSFLALGQTVFVDNNTILEGVTLATLASLVGKDVEVSGYTNQDGSIRASRIETKNGLTEYELKGTVQNLNTVGKTFTVGEITVDYSLAQNLQFSLQNGEYVRITVPVASYAPAQNMIQATNQIRIEAKLRIQERTSYASGNLAEVEGGISGFSATTPNSFAVNGMPVKTNSATAFIGGDQSDLANGVMLEIEGIMENGTLLASKVKFKSSVKMDANVEASDAGTITEMGIVVTYTGATVLQGVTTAQLGANSVVGYKVRICAYRSGSLIIANNIEVKSTLPSSRVMLEGTVDTSTPPVFTVLGVTVDTTQVPTSAFLDINNAIISSTTFFSLIKPETTIVRSKGTYNSTSRTITADEVKIESL